MTETLDECKRRSKREIDQGAGTVRGRYITSVRGQSETYLIKEQQARAWLSDTSQEIELFKLPCAEIGITGTDMLDVCTKITQKADEWVALAAAVEAVRLGTKKQIDAATTVNEIEQINSSVMWPIIS
ncbi:hypothetical protein [Kordiimonas aquimaris]|uniref:hypothetical protein n=1 Tax=Kordiimonas aquimaris TaxID=707591 RepID=UPI0021D24985|nr:hypothetical protein [Kordiimonas aquimaris]